MQKKNYIQSSLRKKVKKKMKSFQGILCMVRMSEIKKNVPLSDDNVKGKKKPFWGYSRRWLLFDKVATF